MKTPQTFDDYLVAVSKEQRAALEKLRRTIKAAAPRAQECISYGLAAFKLNGRPLVAIGASTNHCAFYPMNATSVAEHAQELRGYETSKGTIRFPANKPLPVSLVRKLVQERIAEVASGGAQPKKAKSQQRKSKSATTRSRGANS